MTRKICCIYRIRNIKNNKLYIGSSKNLYKRKIRHLRDLRIHKHNSILLQRAWIKYGPECFVFEVVEETNNHSLLEREQYYLDTLQPYSPNGYNIGKQASGGDNITHHPNRAEIIKKITYHLTKNQNDPSYREELSKRVTGPKNPNYGKKWSREQKERARKQHLGKKHSEKTKQKMKESSKKVWQNKEYVERISKQRTGKGNSFHGRHHTEEIKKRLSDLRKDQFKNKTPEERAKCNPQIKLVSINGVTYFGVSEASRMLGVCPATIIYRIKSKNPKFESYYYLDSNSHL